MSRVIHGLDRVRPSTRQRVLDVIDALGFIPDGAAQSLARHRKEVIGLVGFKCPGPGTDVEQDGMLFLDEVMRGVEGSLSEIGWSLLISVLPRGGDLADAAERLQKISAKVDGLIIAEGVVVGPWQLRLLAGRIPIALVAGRPGEAHADVIHADNRAGTTALVRHLVEQHGRTRLFYVSGPLEAPDTQERCAAFAEALAAYPEARQTGSYEGLFTALSGQLAVREILARPLGDRPDAIVCANDQMAIGAIRELQTAGLRVPADIAVVGFDDIQHRRDAQRAADHGSPAHASAGGAGLLPAAGADRRPVAAAAGRVPARAAGRPGKLRLPRPGTHDRHSVGAAYSEAGLVR